MEASADANSVFRTLGSEFNFAEGEKANDLPMQRQQPSQA